ncbi:hypothetical protein BC628DRAFT_1358150 [Trametes gibbosa]|nr:hypothetical protein BC628DRAFT_1358150 [Trametes gibbosa]
MQKFTSFLAIVGLAFAAVHAIPVADLDQPQPNGITTTWQPTATVVETHTFTATRVEHRLTDVPPFLFDTTFPITWTQTETKTVFRPVTTDVPDIRRHARDFETS